MTRIERIVVVQAMNSTVDDHWYRSLETDLVADGASVVLPAMPDPFEPKPSAWQATLKDAVGEVDAATAIVAHSVGNAGALRYLTSLGDGWTLGALVNVGGFSDPQPGNPWTIPFAAGIDHDRVREKTVRRHAFISSDDPEVPNALSVALADRLDSTVHRIEDAGHFRGDEDGYRDFPELEELLRSFVAEPALDAPPS